MEKLIINRRKWLRGKGDGALRQKSSGKMCCLGFYCRLNNALAKTLTGMGMPSELSESCSLPEWLFNIAASGYMDDSSDSETLASINDNPDISPKDREERISKIFKKHKVEVEFV